MIGLILITHGHLGQEFMRVLDHVMGPQENVINLAIQPHDAMDEKRLELCSLVEKLDQGKGVIILTDMFGGTPSNIAHTLLGKANIEVISGFNLPMLIKLATIRSTHELHDAVIEGQEAGKKYMQLSSNLLKK